MPLNFFYTMVQKSQIWPKTQIKGGPALIGVCVYVCMCVCVCHRGHYVMGGGGGGDLD